MLTFNIDYQNWGPGVALSSVVSDQLPAGASFVSASSGYVVSGSTVSWTVGNLGVNASGRVSVTVTLQTFGTYTNTAHVAYRVGLNTFGTDSNTTSTVYGAGGGAGGMSGAGVGGGAGSVSAGSGGTSSRGSGGASGGSGSGTGGGGAGASAGNAATGQHSGCSCRIGERSSASATLLETLLLGVGLFFVRVRRRRS
jgi:uncharacterized repeat protein (TIGR01451 family)/MYXO-CTERM domain-containing protein